MQMIEAVGLSKRYGSTPVLEDVDLVVSRGEIVALLGPNGAGKTTTVRILSTLLAADGGRARVAGFDVVGQRHEVRRRIAVTGQYAALDEAQTGRENLAMMCRFARLSRAAACRRAAELLERFDLAAAADRRGCTSSGGGRRRLDLAASLVRRPDVLFLDEPTTGLDPRSRQQLWQVVRELTADGTTVLLTTQYLEEADRLAGRIAVLDAGRVIASGTSAELKSGVGGQRLELVAVDGPAFARLHERVGGALLSADPADARLAVAVRGGAAEVRALLDDLDPGRSAIARFAVSDASLDDVFLALTGHAAEGRTQRETADV